MNECCIIRDLLPLYIDKALSPETDAFVREHLKRCPECRRYLRQATLLAYGMQDQAHKGNYRYSAIVKRIRRNRRLVMTAAGTTLLAAVVCNYIRTARQED